jgi:hypothetical protein
MVKVHYTSERQTERERGGGKKVAPGYHLRQKIWTDDGMRLIGNFLRDQQGKFSFYGPI